MDEIHHDFGLTNKVTKTTLDNGSNYCFHEYQKSLVEDQDLDLVEGQPINLTNRLKETESFIEFPFHQRCW